MSAQRSLPPADWLLADVGGTNVRFALAQPAAAAPLLLESIRAYRVAEFASLADAAKAYLAVIGEAPAHAVFALAGRVEGSLVQMTNHAWSISAPQLQHDLGLHSLKLVNDFAAIGVGLPLLAAGDVLALGPSVEAIARGRAPQTYCVLGPGTGLGVSTLAIRDGQLFGLETEGGHVSFAPTSDEEIAILRQLMTRFGRVSIERLLCGSGLVNVHRAICALAQVEAGNLSPEEVTAGARQHADPHCVHAIELFCDMLGSVAGDFALSFGAWDGVYLAGGMLDPLLPWLRQGRFRLRFNDKGRFSQAVARVPVALITHPQPGLLGTAAVAVLAAGRPLLRAGPAQ
ncbi:Glucokinase [Burkholderiales bacterium]|nr:Glucokinase [Burkholderiales bacterium]